MPEVVDNLSKILQERDWPQVNVSGLTLLRSPLLKDFSRLSHAFTTRLGGKSPSPFDSFNLGIHQAAQFHKADALSNRQMLCQSLSMQYDALVVPQQVHSKNVAYVDQPQPLKDIDGVATDKVNLPLLLHFADCVPIILYSPQQNVLAAVHAGWRGTASRIAVEAVNMLQTRFNCQPSELVAAIGPAIGPCCYPTGADTAEHLRNSVAEEQRLEETHSYLFWVKNGIVHPNLKAINGYQLWRQGIRSIDISNACTACLSQYFYSHRRTNGQTGRQGFIAALV